jgi:hypothetical protein
MLSVVMLNIVILSVIYAESHCTDCSDAQCGK